MTGIALIDVAIGVIFAILTFSLIASALQEALASVLNWRGRMLRRGLFRLLESAENSPALVGQTWLAGAVDKADLTAEFLDQPSIRALQGSKSFLGKQLNALVSAGKGLVSGITTFFMARADEAKESAAAAKLKKVERIPSAIPRETFAQGLLDTLYDRINKEIEEKVQETKDNAAASIAEVKDRVADAFARAEAAALAAETTAGGSGATPAEDNPDTLADNLLREARALTGPAGQMVKAYASELAVFADTQIKGLDQVIADLPMSKDLKVQVRGALKAMAVSKALKARFDQVDQLLEGAAEAATEQIQALEAIVHKTTEDVANWFDQGMDRVTGWYVRRAKYMLFVIGFFMAMIVNFDLIGYSAQLLKDEQLRNRIVAQAETAAAAGNVAGIEVERQTDLILAALAVNSERLEIGDTITAEEVLSNFASIPIDTAEDLGLTVESTDTSGRQVKQPTEDQAKLAAAELDKVFQSMVGAFPVDSNKDGEISVDERSAAVTAFVDNVKETYGQSVDVLKSQFGDQGVAMGRTCPAPKPKPGAPKPAPSLGVKALDAAWRGSHLAELWNGSWLRRTLWQDSLAQCIKHTWEWRAFLSWLLIALGCTLGGQFWFDLLKSVIGVRAAAAGVNSDLKKLVGGKAAETPKDQNSATK